MEDLGLDGAATVAWFTSQPGPPFILVEVDGKQTKLWATDLREAVRRCYIADASVVAKANEHRVSENHIIAAKLPDAVNIMAGDFGEILVYIYHSTQSHPKKLIGPKKWRLKQDRNKSAPYSDVVHFSLPTWPTPTADDVIICSEVKTKSTNSSSDPIASAITDSAKDQTDRLAKTLVWLRDRSLFDDMGSVQIAQLNRFIDATESPQATKQFHAVAVICASLAQAELATAHTKVTPGCSLIVIVVPDLKDTYTAVFESARNSPPLSAAP